MLPRHKAQGALKLRPPKKCCINYATLRSCCHIPATPPPSPLPFRRAAFVMAELPFGPIVLSISVERFSLRFCRSWSVQLALRLLWLLWRLLHLVECDSRGVISSSEKQRAKLTNFPKNFPVFTSVMEIGSACGRFALPAAKAQLV